MPSKSRKQHPVSTAAISLPQVHDATALTSLAHFSPNADFFALLSLAVDNHRLRVFDAVTGSVLAEHTVDVARVTCLSWVLLDLSSDAARTNVSPIKKRKITPGAPPSDPSIKVHLVCLGLSNGTISLFSTTHARVLRTISHPSSLAAIIATSTDTRPSRIWTSSADGVVRLWDASRNELLGSWKNDATVPYSSLSSRPGQNYDSGTELLVANHTMRLLSLPMPLSSSSIPESQKPLEKCSFTGHASAVTHLQWDQSDPSRFISAAEGDRVVNVWLVPEPSSKHGTMVANIPLDAFARQVSLSPGNDSTLLIVSASGKLALFKLPPQSPKGEKVATVSSCSTIFASSKKGHDADIVAAAFVPHDYGRLRVARLIGGVKPVFEIVSYLDNAGNFIPQVLLSKDTSSGLVRAADGGPRISQTRYVEKPDLAVQSGFEPGQDSKTGDMPAQGVDGDLDVDLAELSLGQRLAALSGEAVSVANLSSASENDVASPAKQSNRRRGQKSRKGKGQESDNLTVPAHSLSRTLVQALHSADTRLLEMCLRHTDETLVLNTVRRLPSQLAVPLLNACVERLGRGAGGNTGKGGGGGASAQRGTGLLRWIRAVLVVHTAHLMTIPDLVSRLSTLHATLTARLSLRDPLLALHGRLQLVLSQIELRASGGPAPLAPKLKSLKQGGKRGPFKYVEGESESEDEVADADPDEMDVERDDGAGSIEDVELGADSTSEEMEESGRETEGQNGEDKESDEGPRLNGFIDEAEEWSEEEDFEDVEE